MRKQIYFILIVSVLFFVTAIKVEAKSQNPEPQALSEVTLVQQPYDIKTIDFVPDGKRLQEEQFLEKTRYFTNKEYAKESLVYRLRLPKDWISTFNDKNYSDRTNTTLLTDIGRYFGKAAGDVRPFVSIQAQELEEEFFAEDWFKNLALLSSYNLRAIKVHSYREVEALYTELTEGNIIYAIHAKVVISGNVLFFVRFAVPIMAYDYFADMQSRTIQSFQLFHPNNNPVENLKDFNFLDVGSFAFPSSWYIKNVNFSRHYNLSVEIHRVEQASRITYGKIFVETIKKEPGKNIRDYIPNIINRVEEQEWKIDKLISRSKINPPKAFKAGPLEVYTLDVKDTAFDQELWFTFLENDTDYILISMYTPMREISFNDWAKNKAVFYLIIRHFKG